MKITLFINLVFVNFCFTQEMKVLYSHMVEDPQTIGLHFNKHSEGTLEEQQKRENTIQKRAYRFPCAEFSENTISHIKYCKSSIKPRGSLFNFRPQEGGAY